MHKALVLLFIAFPFFSFAQNISNPVAGNQNPCADLFISEYLEGSGNNKAIEIYNPTEQDINLNGYSIQRFSNGSNTVSDFLNLEGVIPAHGTWVVVNGQTEDVDLGGGNVSPMVDPLLLAAADQLDNPFPAPMYMNGNDAIVLANGNNVIDIFGKPGQNPGTAWTDDEEADFTDANGGTWLTSNHTLRRKAFVQQGVTEIPLVFNTLLEWDVLPNQTWDGLGEHVSICADCLEGCTNENACNFNPSAQCDDGSCQLIGDDCDDDDSNTFNDTIQLDCSCSGLSQLFGCTDASACNFNTQATDSDNSCSFPGDACDDENPETINDVLQNDCSCAGEEGVAGCTDPTACNYNSEAVADDGSCIFLSNFNITGNLTPEAFTTETYSYQDTPMSTYEWNITNGAITSGQGTAEVEVVWSSQGSGQITVIETSSEGCVGLQQSLNVVVLPTSIQENSLGNLLVFPNPFSDQLNIDLGNQITFEYQINDLSGKTILKGQAMGQKRINLASLSGGIYYLTVQSKDQIKVLPIRKE